MLLPGPESKPLAFRSHPHLLEINTWVWLDELARKKGQALTLGNVPDREWDSIKDLGFDFIWLMGVWKRSPLGRQMFRTSQEKYSEYDQALPGWKLGQVVGSPYSIQKYQPDPRIGTWEELRQAREKLHARGMGLLLDFVANHTALDHPWIASHPEYYVQGAEPDFRRDPSAFYLAETTSGQLAFIARGKDPYFPPWPDVAQLNYFNPATREAMSDEAREIARYCDGVRCDVAMLILNDIFAGTWGPLLQTFPAPTAEFWSEAIAAVPGFVWMAEVYWDLEWRLQQLGFQFTYDKRLYDRLRGSANRDVYLHLKADLDYQTRLVRCIENHDEERSATVFGPRLPAVATLVATLPGMRFYHQGQLDGRRIRLPIALGAAPDETPDVSVRVFYEKLLRLSNEDVFHSGEWRLLPPPLAGDSASFENVIAYQWRSGEAWKLVVVNLGGEPAQCQLILNGEISASGKYIFEDQLAGSTDVRTGAELLRDGLPVRLSPYQPCIFDVRA